MAFLKRFGIDTYMLLLMAMVVAGLAVPARGIGAAALGQMTFWAVALLFFLYGAKLKPSAVRGGLMNWRVQSMTFGATYLLFPVLGLILAKMFGPLLGASVTMGLLFLAVLPSTVQSSIAFTALAGGNVPAAICAASLSNIIGVVLTPALVTLFLAQDGSGVGLGAIGRISVQILLPFALGQLARPFIGAVIERHKRVTLLVDRGAILLIVYSAFSAGTVSGLWAQVPPPVMAVLIAVILIYLAVGMGLMVVGGRMAGLPREDRIVLFYCGSTKSLATGLPIATAIFPADTVGAIVLPIMIFHMIQLLICAVVAQRQAAEIADSA